MSPASNRPQSCPWELLWLCQFLSNKRCSMRSPLASERRACFLPTLWSQSTNPAYQRVLLAGKAPVKQVSQQSHSFAGISMGSTCMEWCCLISSTDFKLLTRMYYNLSCPPAEVMEGHTAPGIIMIHYYFIMPPGIILTAACMKEHMKVGSPLCHQHWGHASGKDSKDRMVLCPRGSTSIIYLQAVFRSITLQKVNWANLQSSLGWAADYGLVKGW